MTNDLDFTKSRKKRKISGAVRYLGYMNVLSGYIYLRRRKNKISLFLTVVPLSEEGNRMTYYDMIDDEKGYMKEDYTNQFNVLMTKKELIELRDMMNKKLKDLK